MKRGLNHLALLTRDVEATERFYTEVLGLRVAFREHGMTFIATPGGDDLINFVATERRFRPDAGGLDHFGISVPPADWDRMLARLKAAKVEIGGRRGRNAVYVRDPNGYTVELYRD
jgi:catechol 2,3-dioxygenase-like lactoylglutathione lyase family enzyme